MEVLKVRNPHEALPLAISLLEKCGYQRESRFGRVIRAPWPVVTDYSLPLERVVFWPERDANPFLHLYESLWMLAGRNDSAPLIKFAKNFEMFSTNGTIHDAYGHRWRKAFGKDQLPIIAQILRKNPDDRRCVLQMWDIHSDLGKEGPAFPCNLTITFQIDASGRLEMDIFCRSNDIIWGTYGANCVHFSMLLEYMSRMIGCQVGHMRHYSVNWHAYLEQYEKMRIFKNAWNNPYYLGVVHSVEMPKNVKDIDTFIDFILAQVDSEFHLKVEPHGHPWYETVHDVLLAHHIWKSLTAPDRYTAALEILDTHDESIDWIYAAKEWLGRRYMKWMEKEEKKEQSRSS